MTIDKSMYVRGRATELELLRKLWKYGYATMRAPASGRRAKRIYYPDILAVKNGKTLVFEVKLRKHKDTIHLPEYKIRLLSEYARRSGGKAYIAVKISQDKRWYIFPVEELEEQEHNGKKRYVITVGMYDKAKTLYDVTH